MKKIKNYFKNTFLLLSIICFCSALLSGERIKWALVFISCSMATIQFSKPDPVIGSEIESNI